MYFINILITATELFINLPCKFLTLERIIMIRYIYHLILSYNITYFFETNNALYILGHSWYDKKFITIFN